MLLVAFAAWTVRVILLRRVDHNLPLIFYFTIMAYNYAFSRGLDPRLILAGAALAALIRFEFLNPFMVKWISYAEAVVMVMIIWNCLQAVFGPGLALRI
jgi:hypothetical protein